MSLAVTPILTAVKDAALRLGVFADVAMHEPKNAPLPGIPLAVWARQLQPIGSRSGLHTTSYRVELTARQYRTMNTDPEDSIDNDMMLAADQLMNAFSVGFTLDGTITAVDLLGAWGTPLGWVSGYLTINQTGYRIIDHTVPLIVDDVQNQGT